MNDEDKILIEEVVEENVLPEKEHELPEAPISITIKGYYKGFSVLLTKRLDERELTPQIVGVMAVIDNMINKGFQPSWNTDTNAKVNGETKTLDPICPIHNKAMTNGKWGWYCKTKVGESWCKYSPAQKESKELKV